MSCRTLNPRFTIAHPSISLPRASLRCCWPPLPRQGSFDRKQIICGAHWNARNLSSQELAYVLKSAIRNGNPEGALRFLHEMESRGFKIGCDILSDLMLSFAKNGFLMQAQTLWTEIINSSFVPSVEVIWGLMKAYGRMDQFDEINRIVNEIAVRDFDFTPQVYSMAITCFGKAGQLQLMEETVKQMVLRGFKIDSLTGNSFVKYYSIYGSVEEMEEAYQRLKKSRILIEKDVVRSMALTYINQREFYKFSEFLRDVGLGRRNLGNLLWNLLLLSYAANFKMKSLQREFLSMLEAGFSPDITTFNIRALTFSRMSMFWDLHLSIEHMSHKGVTPDIVTYGCIVDAYLGRRLAKNIHFGLGNLNVGNTPLLLTDPLVFKAFGKGDFHSSSEALLQSANHREWTYSKLLAIHMKKQYRKNQFFWNY
ncbi:pentatricopeptide repeat-containing protein At3g42630-like isoform X1 [Zingiber officinale]|uniref:pentatricopeptide repeat-containing protein At3g42630-like isoform X1 n=1 Tax=Zingiber officinale TaxID=94328 RepID=UPI001C4B39B2|nr:pentatricopeptide repeat-containing protein At3g42630-like isoform X1 [Zingiber officinale]XP_042444902.1 pentatricopeptide repeat-containing protein At3g42630-like isoform X1 [Zingiber officinale]XP_042444910.1 pentatricopeptide repeat-containing protein At3g42630-like isoform X1 [Zingiber officinale]XP_042444918.1 pentatricopeptide repeat-containing protein At3g42630-like isoform X1 [Zingiber officinale]XP_042444928.1 pentatricopeptide repeat-containing protein At3g42630-like isoform X1 [Z